MARQRISRKDLKLNEPDQFISLTTKALEWAKAHVREIVYGVVGVVVLIVIIMGWNSWQHSRRNTAAVMLHQALKLVKPPARGAQAPATPTPDTDKAIEQLQAIAEDYGSTPAGAQAYWHLGHQYMAKGDAKAALGAYENARKRFPTNQSLNYAMATLNVGQAQEATGACDQAIESYEALQLLPVGWLQAEAYLGLGRCHEMSGAKDKAIAVYDRALGDERLTSDVQDTINERLTRLQPPVTPPPITPKAEGTSKPPTPAATSSESQSEAAPKTEATPNAGGTTAADADTQPKMTSQSESAAGSQTEQPATESATKMEATTGTTDAKPDTEPNAEKETQSQ